MHSLPDKEENTASISEATLSQPCLGKGKYHAENLSL